MRELKVVGLDVDADRIICETADSPERFMLTVDDRLRAAVSGERIVASQPEVEAEVPNLLRPRDIQSKIRAGASVEQVAAAAGEDVARIERFAHPVLLERSRAAELATAAHPVLADGPSVLTLLETVTGSLIARGLDPESTNWDAWRNEDGRWTVQMAWKAGRSDNLAHFRFTPGAHGGTATPFDDAAAELVDPDFDRPPLRSVTPVPQLDFSVPAPAAPAPAPEPVATPEPPAAPPAAKPARARRRKAEVPGWEDVLLGVRSGTQP
jgi:hypothetical protein